MTLSLLFSALALGQPTPPEPVHFNLREHPYCELSAGETELVTEGDVYIKGDAVNLRKGPSTDSEVITELGIGTPVLVTDACENPEVIGGKSGCWHPVQLDTSKGRQAGYLFSTALTDCRLEVDLDSDGTVEHLYAAIQGDGTLQIRLHDPNHKPHVFWEDVKGVDAEYKGYLGVVPASVAGRALAIVEDVAQEYCGGGSNTDYYAYRPLGGTGFTKAVTAHSHSDSPVYSEQSVVFQPDGTAWVHTASGEPEYVHSFSRQTGHAHAPEACTRTSHRCKDGRDRTACIGQVEAICAESLECGGFAIREALSGEGPHYVLYDDAGCNAVEPTPTPGWDFYFKEPAEEIMHEESADRLLCFRDGVYAACPRPFEAPGPLYMFEEDSVFIHRGDGPYELLNAAGRELTAEERSTAGIADEEEWWVLPPKGPAVQVAVKRHLVLVEKTCGDEMVTFGTELDTEPGMVLAIQGPPPAAWMTAAPSSSIPKDEALALIRGALPERYRDDDAPVIITDSADGWEGWVEWCCPDKSDPLYRESTDELEIHYRLPVILTEDRRVQLGAPYAKEVEMIGDFHPVVRRDVDGDGTLEVLWKGCSHYWTHDDKEVARNTGDCCGC